MHRHSCNIKLCAHYYKRMYIHILISQLSSQIYTCISRLQDLAISNTNHIAKMIKNQKFKGG